MVIIFISGLFGLEIGYGSLGDIINQFHLASLDKKASVVAPVDKS